MIKEKHNQKEDKGKTSDVIKVKALGSAHYIVAHCK